MGLTSFFMALSISLNSGLLAQDQRPEDEPYNCFAKSEKCSFAGNLKRMRQRQPQDNISDYLNVPLNQEIEDLLLRRSSSIWAENYPDGLSEIKSRIFQEAMEVTAGDLKKTALILAMAMQESYEIRGWDTTKDGYTDGSRNFSVFNFNEDFLNSIRHDLNHLKEAMNRGFVDPFYRNPDSGVDLWSKFNRFEGRGSLREQIILLNAAFDLWGVTNVLVIHRRGYDGLMYHADDELTTVYVHGIRETTKFLLDEGNREFIEPGLDSHLLGIRVARYIEHI